MQITGFPHPGARPVYLGRSGREGCPLAEPRYAEGTR